MDQPRDPFREAAAEYCRMRHVDAAERDKCQERGRCGRCEETVRRIVRTWLTAGLTE